MHRLFIAFRPPPAIIILLMDMMEGVPAARLQSETQIHLTLRYIGEVNRPVAEDIALALANFSFAAFPISLSGVGSFDRKHQSRPLWAGLAPTAPLVDLHRKLDRVLMGVGLPPEGRAYEPHITLARFGRDKASTSPWLIEHGGLASAPFLLDHVALYESHLTQGGASYEEMTRVEART